MSKISLLPLIAPDDIDGTENVPVVKDGEMRRSPVSAFFDKLASTQVDAWYAGTRVTAAFGNPQTGFAQLILLEDGRVIAPLQETPLPVAAAIELARLSAIAAAQATAATLANSARDAAIEVMLALSNGSTWLRDDGGLWLRDDFGIWMKD